MPHANSDTVIPESLHLNIGEVHVWRASLGHNSSLLQNMFETLSPDEKTRAERYHFDKDKNHFIAARGILREILSRYLETDPVKITFTYSSLGKPALDNSTNNYQLKFNVSHSNGMALYAFSKENNIGIDIEYMRNDVKYEDIAIRFFSQQEASTLRSLPGHLKTHAFYNCWTRKEAYLKAKGEGLTASLNQFNVSLAPGEPAALLSNQQAPEDPSRWSLHELDVCGQYVAALAFEGIPSSIKCRPWRYIPHQGNLGNKA